MKLKKNIIALGAGLVLASPVFAEGMSYTYAQAAAGTIDIDGVDGTLFGVSGSFEVSPNVFIGGGYVSGTSDDSFVLGGVNDEIGLTQIQVGIGYHHALQDNLDLVATLGFGEVELEHDGLGSGDESFTAISLGLRAKASETVEVSGGLTNTRADGESETGVGLGIRGYVNETLSIGARYDTADDVDQLSVNIRVDL